MELTVSHVERRTKPCHDDTSLSSEEHSVEYMLDGSNVIVMAALDLGLLGTNLLWVVLLLLI